MFIKKSFNDEHAIDFLKPEVNINDVICRRKKRCRITSTKKPGILKVLKGVTSSQKAYWENIDVNENGIDLCEFRDGD